MRETLTRRQVLRAAASAVPFAIVPGSVLSARGGTPPSEKLAIAGIGIGGMGQHNLRQVETEAIVALCDVDHAYAARVFARYPGAQIYKDFREMLDARKDIDAVIVATPDHTHAVISMAAIRAKKHVYCQKPLTHDVFESRMLAKAAREAGISSQMGIQGHSGDGIRGICEWIWDGAIGEIRKVDAWCSLSYYPHGHAGWSSPFARRPQETPPVPETLDWDLWIGPAPMRPYHPAYHPAVWRCWLDFGCGMMGDRGAHTLDVVVWALKLDAPESIEANALGLTDEQHPLASIVTYRFPARGDRPPVKLTWYEGLRPPRPADLEDGKPMGDPEGGVIFHGSEGKIMCGTYANVPSVFPERRAKAVRKPPQMIPRVEGSHEQDWVRACKAGRPAGANFDYSGPLTEICLLGNVARRMDARIAWDAENLRVTNLPDANKLIRTTYREGWSL